MKCLTNLQPLAVSDTAGRVLRTLSLAPATSMAHLLRRFFTRLFLREADASKENTKDQSVALVFLISEVLMKWLYGRTKVEKARMIYFIKYANGSFYFLH